MTVDRTTRTDDAVRDAYMSDTSGDRLDALWDRIDGQLAAPIPEPIRAARSSRHALRALLVAAAVLALGGGAIAFGAEVVDTILGDDAPTSQHIDQFQREDVERATAKEYKQVVSINMVPPRRPKGAPKIFPESEMVPLYELAPIDKSRVVVDDKRVGRLVAVPSLDGKEMCFLHTSSSVGLGTGGCTDRMPPHGVISSGGWVSDVGFLFSGFAADDVSRIDIRTTDGKLHQVTLVENAFSWASDLAPTEYIVTRRDRTFTERLHDMTPPPRRAASGGRPK